MHADERESSFWLIRVERQNSLDWQGGKLAVTERVVPGALDRKQTLRIRGGEGGFADSLAIENMEVIDFTIRKICKTAADSQLQRDLQANLLQFRSTHHGGFL